MSDLDVPFVLHGISGTVTVSVRSNDDPHALGCDLLDAHLPPDAAAGFPVCEAVLRTTGRGYRAASGWMQVVRSSDGSGGFEMDPLALFRKVDTPFAYFGISPTLFDAPFRESKDDLDWRARSFLCAIPDGVMSNTVVPVAAFEWGFTIRAGEIGIAPPRSLPLEAWNDHVQLYSGRFPGWTFVTVPGR